MEEEIQEVVRAQAARSSSLTDQMAREAWQRNQNRPLTESDILWFSKRTKVFSHDVYHREEQVKDVLDSSHKMNAVVPFEKQDIDEVAFGDKVVEKQTKEDIVCTVCLDRV